jgi:hypothetical protein
MRRILKEKDRAADFEYWCDPENRTTSLLSTTFQSDVADAAATFRRAQEHFAEGNWAKAEDIARPLVPHFPCLPAPELLIQCWRQLRVRDFHPDAEILEATMRNLDRAVQAHELGLKTARRLLPRHEAAAEAFTRDRTLALASLRSHRTIASRWFRSTSEFMTGRQELRSILEKFRTLASARVAAEKKSKLLEALVADPFGAFIHQRFSDMMRESDTSLSEALFLLAPFVATRPLTTMSDLEAYATKKLHHELEARISSNRVLPLPESEWKQVVRYRTAQTELVQALQGKQPTDERLCEHLGWSKNELLRVRDLDQIAERKGRRRSD